MYNRKNLLTNRQARLSLTTVDTMEKENIVSVKENIGRWDATEHRIFLEGLQKYGSDWKQIAAMITTRNLVQVRTHAQKYFQKIAKNSSIKSSFVENKKRIKEHMKYKTHIEVEKPRPQPLFHPVFNDPLDSSDSSTSKNSVSRPEISQLAQSLTTVSRCSTPRSPLYCDYYLDCDSLFLTSDKCSYQYSYPFDTECNNNLDDMLYCDNEEFQLDALV